MRTPRRTCEAKLRTLELARRTGNVSEACRRAGISRSQYYLWQQRFRAAGVAGLESRPRRAPRMPNETPAAVVDLILEATIHYPSYSYDRLSRLLRRAGHGVTRAQVRGVWRRRGLNTFAARLAWLAAVDGRLSERRRLALERANGSPRS